MAPSVPTGVASQVTGGSAPRREKLTKKKSVQRVVRLSRSLLRGSALRQLAPLVALAVGRTALIHVTALTQGELFRTVFLGDRAAFVRLLARNLLLCLVAALGESTKLFAEGTVALRWREALTGRAHAAFFGGTVYYRLCQLDRRVENVGEALHRPVRRDHATVDA